MIFDLSALTPRQREITQEAINRCTFDWSLLEPKLLAEKGKSKIPVEWVDLSRYAAQLAEQKAQGKHAHIHERGDTGHPIEARSRVLGLAWYSGKVSIEQSLESEPQLAMEVFLAEGAHMVDFFYMTDEQRGEVFDAYHADDLPEHGHDWFDKGTYWEWVGESFMSGFMVAYSDLPISLDNFTHKTTTEVANKIRQILTPELEANFGYLNRSKSFHKADHWRKRWDVAVASREEAASTGRMPCKVCKP